MIEGISDEFAEMPSVQMRPPPEQYMNEAMTHIRIAVADLNPNEKGAIAWIATTKGVNLAIVSKINDHVQVAGWVAKDWGKPIAAGVVGKVTW